MIWIVPAVAAVCAFVVLIANSPANVLQLLSKPGLYELRHEKTGFLHMRKQRRRSASRLPYREADQRLCFRYTYSTIPLLPKSEILRGEAVLYIIPRSLDPRKVDQSFATICKSAKCFRLLVLKEILTPGMSTEPLNALENRQSCDLNCSSCCCSLCLCCSNCKQSCKCFATAE